MLDRAGVLLLLVRRFAVWGLWLVGSGMSSAGGASQPKPSVAFYYGSDIPVEQLDVFDWVVVEPAHVLGGQLEALQANGAKVFAYVSIGELRPHERADRFSADTFLPDNENWGSRAADLTRAEWADYIAKERIGALWAQGYRALFFDTLDNYRLFAKDDASVAAQQEALASLIRRIRTAYPGIELLLNRGFEVLDRVHEDIVGVAAESLYRSWNAGEQTYQPVKSADREYLLAKLGEVTEKYGLPAIAIDYVQPKRRGLARKTAKRIAEHGLIPWVTNAALDQVGVGSIEPMPRRVLADPFGRQSAQLGLRAVFPVSAQRQGLRVEPQARVPDLS